MKNLLHADQEIYDAILREEQRHENSLELIASENYASKAVLDSMSTVLNTKYSEGYIGKRYYGGNDVIDTIEGLAIDRAKKLFGAEHANVQPLSGSPANCAVYMGVIKPGDKVMGLKLDHGGHLSHGHPVNSSGQLYNFVQYGVDENTGYLNVDKVREMALIERPKILVVGFSAYSRNVDWQAFKDIADEIGAISFADIAHIAGLVAGGAIENPVPLFDIVTTTTHKTLRGPRGGLILCKEKFQKAIDRAVFPGMQGGPHDHMTAAKAVCFKEALAPEFKEYAKNVIKNAKALANALLGRGFEILTGGTDNHLMVLNLNNKGISGREAEKALDKVGISCSRSTVPADKRKPMDPSGIRLGTSAITTRGLTVSDMDEVAQLIDECVHHHANDGKLAAIRAKVKNMCSRYPLAAIIGSHCG